MAADNTTKESADNGYSCPSCDKKLPTEHGLKCHHSRVHGESLAAFTTVECLHCGDEIRRYSSEIERKDRHFCDKSCELAWQREERPSAECSHCGASLSLPPSEVKEKEHDFCDAECYEEWRSAEIVETECGCCGSSLERPAPRLERAENQFCNPDCRAKWQAEAFEGEDSPSWNHRTVGCAQCGDDVSRPQSVIEGSDRNFCDDDCRGEWLSENVRGENHPCWEGGRAPYGSGWSKRKRERVRERDGRECQSCGMAESEHRDRYNRRLHVHHIQKARQFDDPEQRNAMENLVTLCLSCHNYWEQMTPLRPETA